MSEVVARVEGYIPIHGQATVTTAGTRVRLTATPTPLSSGVTVRARGGSVGTANTGLIYVGSLTVTSANGFVLAPGESKFIETRDLSTIYIDAGTNGDQVSYIAI